MYYDQGADIETISTHALTEGDGRGDRPALWLSHFNSRPHGGRPMYYDQGADIETFQLTPSRRATLYGYPTQYSGSISTHALTEGDDNRQK